MVRVKKEISNLRSRFSPESRLPGPVDLSRPDWADFASGRRTRTRPGRITNPSDRSRGRSPLTVRRVSQESCSGPLIRTRQISFTTSAILIGTQINNSKNCNYKKDNLLIRFCSGILCLVHFHLIRIREFSSIQK